MCDACARRCCKTCAEVQEAYRRKGWVFNPTAVKQCAGAGGTALAAPGPRIPPDSEACRIFGSLLVNKVPSLLRSRLPSRSHFLVSGTEVVENKYKLNRWSRSTGQRCESMCCVCRWRATSTSHPGTR